jgi:nucleotide-binding universal stress UspA family protein
LVVLGKPDTDAAPDELVSSLSLNLLRAISVPLLVVPIAAAADDVPQKLLLAVDGQAFQLDAPITEAAQQLLQGLSATPVVVQVAAPDADDDPAAAVATVASSGLAAGLPQVQTHRLRHSTIPGGIVQAAAETQADLLVLVARRRSFLGQLFNSSVSAQVILHSPIPVLLLPE